MKVESSKFEVESLKKMEKIKILEQHRKNINIDKKLTNNITWLFLAFLSIAKINAQAITEDAEAIQKNKLQLETALIYEYQNQKATWTFPSVLVRYGLNDNIEFRLATSIETKKHLHNFADGNLSNIEVGFKMHLLKTDNTNLSFISHFIFPTKFNEWRKNTINTTAVMVFSQNLGKKFQIGSSLQYVFDNSATNDINYSLIFSYFINDKWKVYAETYGDFFKNSTITNMDFGFEYQISRKFLWQVSAGTNLKQQDYHFMSTGFVWQIN